MEPLWPGRPLDAGHTFCRVELSHCAASGGSASDGEGLVQANGGDVVALRNMANELSVWFLKHAQTMDAALALHLRRVGQGATPGRVAREPDSGLQCRRVHRRCHGLSKPGQRFEQTSKSAPRGAFQHLDAFHLLCKPLHHRRACV